MEQVEVFAEIDAPPPIVWDVLLAFDRYPEWNPYVRAIEGTPNEGETLRVRIRPPDSRPVTFTPEVVAVEANRRLAWVGRLVVPLAFDRYHEFRLEPIGEDGSRTRLLTRETFRGALVSVLFDEARTTEGFAAMNRALKDRAESRYDRSR